MHSFTLKAIAGLKVTDPCPVGRLEAHSDGPECSAMQIVPLEFSEVIKRAAISEVSGVKIAVIKPRTHRSTSWISKGKRN